MSVKTINNELFRPDHARIKELISKVESLNTKSLRKGNKILSKLNHDEWLIFMRSIWRFNEMTTYVKTYEHPAQFSAEIPRRVIKLYSFVNELVLDPFVGVGTTLIESLKLKRFSIGVDINPRFLEIGYKKIQRILKESLEGLSLRIYEPIFIEGDARNLSFLEDESVHLILAHPPYWNAVRTSDIKDDLANFSDSQYSLFLTEMERALSEMHRVLKPERVCAIFTGDVLRRVDGITRLYPLHADYIKIAEKLGFRLWDIFIVETKIRKSGGKPMMGSYPYPHKLFSEFAHNYLLIFRKNEK
jgi:DNA modification methylase